MEQIFSLCTCCDAFTTFTKEKVFYNINTFNETFIENQMYILISYGSLIQLQTRSLLYYFFQLIDDCDPFPCAAFCDFLRQRHL